VSGGRRAGGRQGVSGGRRAGGRQGVSGGRLDIQDQLDGDTEPDQTHHSSKR
jgi:hypothetical protein